MSFNGFINVMQHALNNPSDARIFTPGLIGLSRYLWLPDWLTMQESD